MKIGGWKVEHIDTFIMGMLIGFLFLMSYIGNYFIPEQYRQFYGVGILIGFFLILGFGQMYSYYQATQHNVYKAFIRSPSRNIEEEAKFIIDEVSQPIKINDNPHQLVRQEIKLKEPIEFNGKEFSKAVIYAPDDLRNLIHTSRKTITYNGFDIKHPNVGLVVFDYLGMYNDAGEFIVYLVLRDSSYIDKGISKEVNIEKIIEQGEVEKVKDENRQLKLYIRSIEKHAVEVIKEAEGDRIKAEERVGHIIDRHGGVIEALRTFGGESWLEKLKNRDTLLGLALLGFLIAVAVYRYYFGGGV